MPPTSQPLNADTFARVLSAAQVGEQWAAETVFVDLQPRLLRFLRSTEPRAADDLAGEVWLSMARGIGQFEGDLAGFRAWVFSIARRRLADHRRTALRRNTEPVDDGFFRDLPAPADTADSVSAALSAQGAVDLIARELPADQAEVLMLRILADLDVAHVAELMGRSANWVRVTQHRALRRLADVVGRKAAEGVMPGTPQTICTP